MNDLEEKSADNLSPKKGTDDEITIQHRMARGVFSMFQFINDSLEQFLPYRIYEDTSAYDRYP
jgi:hypothetical protein